MGFHWGWPIFGIFLGFCGIYLGFCGIYLGSCGVILDLCGILLGCVWEHLWDFVRFQWVVCLKVCWVFLDSTGVISGDQSNLGMGAPGIHSIPGKLLVLNLN